MKAKSLKLSEIVMFFVTIILFRPTIIMYMGSVDRVFSLAANLMYGLVIMFWIYKGVSTDSWMRAMAVFCGTVIVSTFLNNGNTKSALFVFGKIFISCLIIKFMVDMYGEKAFVAMKSALLFLVIINMLSLIAMPEGVIQVKRVVSRWYEYEVPWWVFGNKNGMLPWLFPTNIIAQVSILKRKSEGKKAYFDYFIVFTTFVSAFLSKSSTTIVTMTLLTMFIFIYRYLLPLKRFFGVKVILAFYIIFTVMLITSSQLGIFEFVANIFGKDATFTGRTTAWENSLPLIANSPILGYGMLSVDTARKLLGAYAFVNAHNTFLQTLLEGGLLLLLEFFSMFMLLDKKTKNMKAENQEISFLIQWSLLVFCLQMSFEAYTDSRIFWFMITIMYYILNFIEKEKRTEI